MKVDVATVTGEVYGVESSPELTLEDFKAFLRIESGIPPEEMGLSFNLRPLQDDTKSLTEYGITDGSLLVLERKDPRRGFLDPAPQATEVPHIDWSSVPVQSDGSGATAASSEQAYSDVDQDDPEVIRQMFLSNPYQMSLLRERNPPLAEAVESEDKSLFAAALEQQRRSLSDRNVQRIRTINADPMDAQAQGVIAEDIRLENVQSNMETAIEHSPEAFGQVVMLYIECQVNGHPVKAFVDSGAQMTIMSVACADRCGIMRLVDSRFGGIARGVGMQRIVGRVHLAQVKVGGAYLPCAFSIMQDQPMEMLLGLDMLKRHQCCIDLKKNVLHIGTTRSETRFLPESELTLDARGATNLSSGNQASETLNRTIQNEEDRQLAEALSESEAVVAQQAATFKEEDIKKLMELGFTRDEVVHELRSQGGNVDKATVSLLGKSFGSNRH